MKKYYSIVWALLLFMTAPTIKAQHIDLSGLKAKKNTFNEKNYIEQVLVKYLKTLDENKPSKAACYSNRSVTNESEFYAGYMRNDKRCVNILCEYNTTTTIDGNIAYVKCRNNLNEIIFNFAKIAEDWKIVKIDVLSLVKSDIAKQATVEVSK